VTPPLGQSVLRVAYTLYRVYLWIARPLTVGVRVMMIRDGRALLIRQTYLDGWFMPGGGIHKGETLEQAARREIREEVEGDLHNMTLLGAYSNFEESKNDHTIVFFSDDFTLAGGHDREVAEIRFFPLDALPTGLRTGHRLKLQEYARDPSAAKRTSAASHFGEW
jgi:8-oxo-dGTP pyrophosphatase MutT (NUDIX family)